MKHLNTNNNDPKRTGFPVPVNFLKGSLGMENKQRLDTEHESTESSNSCLDDLCPFCANK